MHVCMVRIYLKSQNMHSLVMHSIRKQPVQSLQMLIIFINSWY